MFHVLKYCCGEFIWDFDMIFSSLLMSGVYVAPSKMGMYIFFFLFKKLYSTGCKKNFPSRRANWVLQQCAGSLLVIQVCYPVHIAVVLKFNCRPIQTPSSPTYNCAGQDKWKLFTHEAACSEKACYGYVSCKFAWILTASCPVMSVPLIWAVPIVMDKYWYWISSTLFFIWTVFETGGEVHNLNGFSAPKEIFCCLFTTN